ncbi:MAG: iron ABC transporter substrate-binding protein [Desulfobacteraceae bacterium]|nr:iron ABC transporter substrate-binding protein [Desulfobacteraceae bacterium]
MIPRPPKSAAALILILVTLMLVPGLRALAGTLTVTDAAGRELTVPDSPDHVLCSGAGCLRLLSYLQALDRVAAVDSMEKMEPGAADPRPYFLANRKLEQLPLFGEFRGRDNPELIAALEPQPQVIFKTFASMGTDPAELQEKTGIPVIILSYGNLDSHREDLYSSLRLMGRIMGKTERAETVIEFFNQMIADLDSRTEDFPESQKKSCYVGGISFKGPHGVQSTEPDYPPFIFTHAKNPAYDPDTAAGAVSHARVAKEKVLIWNPDIIFLDLASTLSNTEINALRELRQDPAYRHLDAVKEGRVYGVMPYNWYAQNFGAIFANAYFVGKLLYPQRFADIEPVEKADHIFEFLVGAGVYEQINAMFQNRIFARVIK